MLEAVRRWQAEGAAVASLTVVEAKGSTPREAGAVMFVTADGQAGTIGGGRLEWDCMAEARALLASGGVVLERHVPLGPAINQCCGGAVTVEIRRVEDLAALEAHLLREREMLPRLVLFGAGHVGRALAACLSLLPLHLVWVDAREEEFGVIPCAVEARVTTDWESVLRALPAGSGVLVLTQSHTLDALIVGAALDRADLRYVGMIGSRTKRRRFERAFREVGLSGAQIDALVCPIGDVGVRDKRPEVIAAFVAAEVARVLLA